MDDIKLFILDFVDEIITLDVNPSTTIHQLFPRLRNSIDDLSDYLLLFRGRNLLDSSTSTLQHCGIKDQDQLILSRKGLFHLRVQTATSLSYIFRVETLETVRELKEKIHGVTGVPVEKQGLYYCFSLMEDDDGSLASYGIFNPWDEMDDSGDMEFGYVVQLHTDDCPGCVHCLLEGSVSQQHPVVSEDQGSSDDCTIVIEVPTTIRKILLRLAIKVNLKDTIDTLKAKIRQKVRNHEVDRALTFIPRELYMLLFNRKVLENGSSTLNECGIKDQDRIILCPKDEFSITVVLVLAEVPSEMQVHEVRVHCSDTVGMLRTKIKDLGSISSKKPIIARFRKRWLDDDEKCLVEHGIVEFPVTDDYPNYYWRNTETNIVEALTYGVGDDKMQLG